MARGLWVVLSTAMWVATVAISAVRWDRVGPSLILGMPVLLGWLDTFVFDRVEGSAQKRPFLAEIRQGLTRPDSTIAVVAIVQFGALLFVLCWPHA